jgi:voltage-gated potassium channel Kch
LLPDISLVDALYMTAITLSTVGFGEVTPLTPSAKIFTIFFIMISLTVFAFGIKELTQFVLTENIFEKIKQKKTKKMTATLKDHTLICGYGRNGRQALHRLLNHGHPFVVIEQNQAVVQEHEKIHFLEELSWLEKDSPNLEEVAIDALPKKYLNRSLSELEIRRKTHCNVVGFRNAQGQLIINPPADLKLESHSKLIVLGDGSAISKLNAMFDLD